jgi:hypothetical protein
LAVVEQVVLLIHRESVEVIARLQALLHQPAVVVVELILITDLQLVVLVVVPV